jgi:hypothetical protein
MYKVRLSTEAQGFYAEASLPIAKKIAIAEGVGWAMSFYCPPS